MSSGRRYTIDRARAREVQESGIAEQIAQWLIRQLGSLDITSDNLCEKLEDGVILCRLAKRFGQITRYWDPPKNEFQRRENIALFTRSCNRLCLACEPIPNKKGLTLRDVIPTFFALASLARRHRRSLRRVSSSIPSDLQESLEEDPVLDEELSLEEIGEVERFSRKCGSSDFNVLLAKSNMGDITWGGCMVLLQDMLIYQQHKFLKHDHQMLCLGADVTLCGLWAAMKGSDVILTDFPKTIDVIWSNISANAGQIRESGGSCGARALTFKNFDVEMAMVLSELDPSNELTVLASDWCFDATYLSKMVNAIFNIRKDATFYIVCQHDHVYQEFFQALKGTIQFLQVFGDMEYRIIKGQNLT